MKMTLQQKTDRQTDRHTDYRVCYKRYANRIR